MKKSIKKNSGNNINETDQKLTLILKEIFGLKKYTEQGFIDMRGDFRQLQSAVDAYAKKADTYFQEMLMLANKVRRLEKWILQIAEKVGVRLKSY